MAIPHSDVLHLTYYILHTTYYILKQIRSDQTRSNHEYIAHDISEPCYLW